MEVPASEVLSPPEPDRSAYSIPIYAKIPWSIQLRIRSTSVTPPGDLNHLKWSSVVEGAALAGEPSSSGQLRSESLDGVRQRIGADHVVPPLATKRVV